MKRRDLIKFIGTAGMGSMLPYGFSAFAASPVAKLPVPALLKADANGKIHLRIQKGQTRWWRKPTATWGYNGALLGPALWVKREQKISFEVENALDEDTSIHWHGLEIPGMADGGPQSPIQPGAIWRPELTIDQPAATCWFHPHPHGKTGRHVAMGLAGLLLINDEESRRLPLPENWGVDDIPVIFQDKRFNAHDQIDYKLDIVSAAVGWFGDVMLINGAIYPQHSAPRGWLRLRLLNGCNARHIRVAASDKRPLYVIAGDGGFLAEPVKVADLRIFAGERFEVLVDLRDGKPFDLISLPVDQMGMTLPPFDAPLAVLKIVPSRDKGLTTLPDRLVTLPPLPSSSALQNIPVRTFRLSMDPRLDREGMAELMERYGHKAMTGAMEHGSHGGMPAAGDSQDHTMDHAHDSHPLDIRHANFINDKAFVMDSPMVDIQRGRYERWIISGKGDMMLHPFHIHGTQFRILSENGSATPAHRRGFKDTVHVQGEDSEVLVRFNHLAPAEHMFMAHCHLLEHEDTGMMMGFTVSDSRGDKRSSA